MDLSGGDNQVFLSPPSQTKPRGLWLVYVWVIFSSLQLFSAGELLSPSISMEVKAVTALGLVLALAEALLLIPFSTRSGWAWSCIASFFLTHLVSLVALTPWIIQFTRSAPSLPGGTSLIIGVPLGVLAICAAWLGFALRALWAARRHFGIQPRQTWRTLWRQGWWVLVPSLIESLASATLLTLDRM